MATNYKAKGEVLQYTCGASETVSSGDVLFVRGIPGIAIHNIAANATGSIAITGVWEVAKEDDTTNGPAFAQGAPVYWDIDEGEAVLAAGNPLLGYAYEAAGKTDDTVKVILMGDPKDAPILVRAGEALTSGPFFVYISGYNASLGVLEVSKALNGGNFPAQFYAPEDIANEALGLVYRRYHHKDINSSASTVGNLVYLHTDGKWHTAAHTTNNSINQVVGVCTVDDSSEGAILFFPGDTQAKTHSTT